MEIYYPLIILQDFPDKHCLIIIISLQDEQKL